MFQVMGCRSREMINTQCSECAYICSNYYEHFQEDKNITSCTINLREELECLDYSTSLSEGILDLLFINSRWDVGEMKSSTWGINVLKYEKLYNYFMGQKGLQNTMHCHINVYHQTYKSCCFEYTYVLNMSFRTELQVKIFKAYYLPHKKVTYYYEPLQAYYCLSSYLM